MDNIQTSFKQLMGNLVMWNEQKIYYSNQEIIQSSLCEYNGFTIVFNNQQVTSIFKDIPQTFRIHNSLDSLIKEISEERLSFGSFMML